MLYQFLFPFAEECRICGLLRYLTVRAGGAFLTAFLIYFFFGNKFISFVKKHQDKGQPLRTALNHEKKQGTPTMGGLLILMALTVSVLIWGNLQNSYLWLITGTTLAFGCIGFRDDYLKVTQHTSDGLSVKGKLVLQSLFAGIACFLLAQIESSKPFMFTLHFPFFKQFVLDLGWFYPVFAVFVIVGASNAVNITDGLDGLLSFPLVMNGLVFAIVCYLTGNSVFASHLHIPFIAGTGELTVFCAGLCGAVLGFLWFNAPPARIFMGDTGSLALGGALGLLSVMTKSEFILAIAGGLFIIEAMSDIIQLSSKRFLHRRVFIIAPLHHHFEKKGFAETTIVTRCWILSVLLAVLALSGLKIR